MKKSQTYIPKLNDQYHNVEIVNRSDHKPTKNDFDCGAGTVLGCDYGNDRDAACDAFRDSLWMRYSATIFKMTIKSGLRAPTPAYNRKGPNDFLTNEEFNILGQMYSLYVKGKKVFIICDDCLPGRCHCQKIRGIVFNMAWYIPLYREKAKINKEEHLKWLKKSRY